MRVSTIVFWVIMLSLISVAGYIDSTRDYSPVQIKVLQYPTEHYKGFITDAVVELPDKSIGWVELNNEELNREALFVQRYRIYGVSGSK